MQLPPDGKEIQRRYPLGAWLDDFQFLSVSEAITQPALAPKIAQELYYKKYPDEPNAEENMARLLAAFRFVGQSQEGLDQIGGMVMGSKADLMSHALSVALYRLFMSIEADELHRDIDFDSFIPIYRQQKKHMEDHPLQG